MSKKERLTEELLQRPSSFKWDDLISVMKYHGFEMKNAKRGSGRRFYNPETKQVAKWHEPHPSNEVKKYVVDEAIALIKEQKK
jgi:hypothetical protein